MAREDFPANTSGTHDSVVVGLAPAAFEYRQLNEAFRLLAGEEGTGKKGQVPLIVTHKARYFGDKDGKLSLGPGALSITSHKRYSDIPLSAEIGSAAQVPSSAPSKKPPALVRK